MTWLVPAALLAFVAVLVLPSRASDRVAALARSGRLTGPAAAVRTGPDAGRPAGAAAVRRLPAPRLLLTGGVACCLALAALVGPLPAVELGIVLGVAGRVAADLQVSRESAQRQSEFRAAVALLAAELRAGTAPPAALAAAAECSPRLGRTLDPAARAAQRGRDTVEVLSGSGDAQLHLLGVVWRVGEATGVPLADVLDQFGVDLRSAAEQRRAVSVALAGPRSSAVLLCLLPLLGIGLGVAMGARPLALLFGTTGGQLLGCAGLLLDAGGVLWVRRILLRAAAR